MGCPDIRHPLWKTVWRAAVGVVRNSFRHPLGSGPEETQGPLQMADKAVERSDY